MPVRDDLVVDLEQACRLGSRHCGSARLARRPEQPDRLDRRCGRVAGVPRWAPRRLCCRSSTRRTASTSHPSSSRHASATSTQAGPVLLLRTFSKIFGLAGLRLGYAVASEELAPFLNVVQEPFNVNRAALAAGRASLRRLGLVAERRAQVAAARERLAQLLTEGGMEPLPSQANFLLVRMGVDDVAAKERLMRRGFLIRAGSEFGLRGYARITVGPNGVMERFAEELAKVCGSLQIREMTETVGVTLEGISKRYGGVSAVRDISLEIGVGEFFSLLGPSGCGKTTSLRVIAGFEQPDEGRVLLGETDLTEVPPHKRPVNTVFQSYALFPHLTVGDNVAFGLRFTSAERVEKRRRVAEALTLVQLDGYEKRKPHQLSGGQQQRVALARALVLNPSVLLLDEPLGALDAKLRRALQLELKTIQREVGITFVYVTHDQEEALTMSDRLAVMSNGRIEQVGTPRGVYEQPATTFVADFLGVSRTSCVRSATAGGGFVLGELELRRWPGLARGAGEVRVTIRPERVRSSPAEPPAVERPLRARRPGRLPRLGDADLPPAPRRGGAAGARLQHRGGAALRPGEPVSVRLPPDALRLLAEGEALRSSPI